MDYELVKQLKDAGFPQKDADWYTSDGQWIPENERKYVPTLEELIEECYKFDVQLILKTRLPMSSTKDRPRWYAHATWWEHNGERWLSAGESSDRKIGEGKMDEYGMEWIDEPCCGETPSEAVAKLWLELNKNK